MRKRAPYEFSWRDRNLACRAAVIVGVGIPLSTDSTTVQRPSPESATKGAIPVKAGSFARASAASSRSQERTTEPFIQREAIFALSSPSPEASKSSNPSAYACIMAYSTPLWTILT